MEKVKLINADDKTVKEVMGQKFSLDFFQREYNWGKKHVEQLLVDLEGRFKSFYKESHERPDVANYGRYYLGPIILSEKNGTKFIIDGQQRLTTMTLLLIYLKHLIGQDTDISAKIAPLIYSDWYGEKSFNLMIDSKDREECISGLYSTGKYEGKSKDESVINIVKRYEDITEFFPEDFKEKSLPFFIDWLIENVIFVEIVTYSDEDAYTIFETMNDRGLSLTPTQMLKGFLLSCLKSEEEKKELNEEWKNNIFELHRIDDKEDLEFFKAWLRAKYAETIRSGKKGAPNEDFEKIGTRFHSWVRDNLKRMNLAESENTNSKKVYEFINKKFDFYLNVYLKIKRATEKIVKGLESIYYIEDRGLASSLYLPLLLSPIKIGDTEDTVNKKLALVAYYLELFVVIRSVNRRNYSHSSIRYTMYNLVKEIRDIDEKTLSNLLKENAKNFDEDFYGMDNLILHGQNKRFIRFFLARLTVYIENNSDRKSHFSDYIDPETGRSFEIEHIWADKFKEHNDEFDQRDEFEEFRNNIGGLLLVPNGFNQSYNDLPYEKKLDEYLKQNLLAQSLHPRSYNRDPRFLNFIRESNLPFKPHVNFKREDLLERQKLYQEIAERIWNLEKFDKILN